MNEVGSLLKLCFVGAHEVAVKLGAIAHEMGQHFVRVRAVEVKDSNLQPGVVVLGHSLHELVVQHLLGYLSFPDGCYFDNISDRSCFFSPYVRQPDQV